MESANTSPGVRPRSPRRRRRIVAGLSLGVAGVLVGANVIPSSGSTATASQATALDESRPTIDRSVKATTATDVAQLPALQPQTGDLVLVAVSTQAWRNIQPVVTGSGLTFEKVATVKNSQRIVDLTVYRAIAGAGAGEPKVSLPTNGGPASVIALRVAGVPTTANGADAIRAADTEPGPTWRDGDNADMQASVETGAGDLAIGIGSNRLRTFVVPDDQDPVALNVSMGGDGSGARVSSSVWSAPAENGGLLTLGDDEVLTGGSGTDDWAMIALSVRPVGKVVDVPPKDPGSTTTLPPVTTAPPATQPPVTTAPPATQPPVTTAPPATQPPVTTAPPTTTAPTTPPPSSSWNVVPYASSSAWNTPIGSNPALHPKSAAYVNRLAQGPGLTSDPTQYSYPVYKITSSTPRRTVQMTGYFSTYTNDSTRKGAGFAATLTDVPVPPEAIQSSGSDGSIVFWDPATGDEWSFWQWEESNGNITATNGYRYNTKWSGRFFDGLAGRGAGLPYLGGLVRPWEVQQGRIDHAIAFAYAWPSSEFVFPASKSDGAGVVGVDLPEGSRIQLDPSLTDADFDQMGLSPAARVIARALQQYGMIVIDNSGSSKIMVEDNTTANWGNTLTRNSVSAIPWDKFRVIAS